MYATSLANLVVELGTRHSQRKELQIALVITYFSTKYTYDTKATCNIGPGIIMYAL